MSSSFSFPSTKDALFSFQDFLLALASFKLGYAANFFGKDGEADRLTRSMIDSSRRCLEASVSEYGSTQSKEYSNIFRVVNEGLGVAQAFLSLRDCISTNTMLWRMLVSNYCSGGLKFQDAVTRFFDHNGFVCDDDRRKVHCVAEAYGNPFKYVVNYSILNVIPSQRYLYHYTSQISAIKILESMTLWMSDLSRLNDANEYQHGRDILDKHFMRGAHLDGVSIAESIYKRSGSGLIDCGPDNVYCLSFTQEGDIANQWLSYAENGAGVSLAFDHIFLKNNGYEYYFGPCVYEHGEKVRLLEDIDSVALLFSIALLSNENLNPSAVMEYIIQLLREAIKPLVMFFKNPSFKYEKEWRMFCIDGGNDIKYRSIEGNTIKYKEFNCKLQNGNPSFYLPIKQIIVGPTASSDFTEKCKRVSEVIGYVGVEVIKSTTPLR